MTNSQAIRELIDCIQNFCSYYDCDEAFSELSDEIGRIELDDEPTTPAAPQSKPITAVDVNVLCGRVAAVPESHNPSFTRTNIVAVIREWAIEKGIGI